MSETEELSQRKCYVPLLHLGPQLLLVNFQETEKIIRFQQYQIIENLGEKKIELLKIKNV